MKPIYNNVIPFKGFTAINLFGVIFARKGTVISEQTIRHESIHTAQVKEMLYLFFYLWYGVEWLIRFVGYGFKAEKAYRNISFEREAYTNEGNLDYLKNRRLFAWLKYFFTPKNR